MILRFRGVVPRDLGSAQLVRSLSVPLTHRARAEDQRPVNMVRYCGHHREWCAHWQSGHVWTHLHKDTHRGNVPPLSVLLWTLSWRQQIFERCSWDNTCLNKGRLEILLIMIGFHENGIFFKDRCACIGHWKIFTQQCKVGELLIDYL